MLSSKALLKIPDFLNLSIDGHPFPGLHGKSTALCYSSAAMAMNFRKKKKKRRSDLVVVSAGYTKRPLETPGAYELVDEESGEKVIVWGGDDESPIIPPKHVISWKPGRDSSAAGRGKGLQNAAGKGDVQTTSPKKLSRAIGRLKVDKVRKLGRKPPLDGGKEGSNSEGEEPEKVITVSNDWYDDEYLSSDSDDEFVERNERITVKPGVGQLHQEQIKSKRYLESNRDSFKTSSTVLLSDSDDEFIERNEHITVRPGVGQLHQEQIKSKRYYESNRDSSKTASTVPLSAVRSKGWGNGEPTQTAWRHPRASQDRLKQPGHNDFFSRKSFKDFGCSPDMIESLRSQNFVRPSHIQAMAFERVLVGKSCILADQSGSGKTLAYLAPIVQRLRQEELEGLSKSSARSPRAVVLVPTAELASQVLKNCRSLSKFGVPFRSMVATGGFKQKTQLESLDQDLDVLIATPGRFIYLIKEGFLQLTNLKCAVFDEVDILFGDEDFEVVLQSLIPMSPVTTQYVFVTATLPLEIYNKLVQIFPDCEVVMGPGVHRTSSGLEEVLVDCSGDDTAEKTPEMAFLNKKTALLQLMERSPVAKTIVFCNKIETCRKVENALRRSDRKENQFKVLPFHAALEHEKRLMNMKQFLSPQRGNESLFMICTDRASRGIDFAGVDHVVLFDFPRDPSEYVRRVGRTARGAGGIGKAFVFVVGKQVPLARRIMERNLKGHPLHEVPSSYELMR